MNFSKLVVTSLTRARFDDASYGLCGLLSNKLGQECMGHVNTYPNVGEVSASESEVSVRRSIPAVTPDDVQKLPSTTQRALGTHSMGWCAVAF